MQEYGLSDVAAGPVSEHCLAPVGLCEDDCQRIASFVRSAAPGWQTNLQEDAFGQLGVVMAPRDSNRLHLALIAYRIDAGWFLEEVRDGALREVGEFVAIDGLLNTLGRQLADCRATQNCRATQAGSRPG
jgi:hypothetical protein